MVAVRQHRATPWVQVAQKISKPCKGERIPAFASSAGCANLTASAKKQTTIII
jgi:hypothetical protein